MYTHQKAGQIVEKHVYVFLVRAFSQEFIDNQDVHSFKWVLNDDLQNQVTFTNDLEMFKIAMDLIEKKYKHFII